MSFVSRVGVFSSSFSFLKFEKDRKVFGKIGNLFSKLRALWRAQFWLDPFEKDLSLRVVGEPVNLAHLDFLCDLRFQSSATTYSHGSSGPPLLNQPRQSGTLSAYLAIARSLTLAFSASSHLGGEGTD